MKQKVDGEEEEGEAEQPPAEEEGDAKKPKFRVEDFRWTVSDRRPKNLAQLFYQLKGINCESKFQTAEHYSAS